MHAIEQRAGKQVVVVGQQNDMTYGREGGREGGVSRTTRPIAIRVPAKLTVSVDTLEVQTAAQNHFIPMVGVQFRELLRC